VILMSKRDKQAKTLHARVEALGEVLHVMPHDGRWAVFTTHGQEPEATFESRESALESGRELARERECELVTHDGEGRVEGYVDFINGEQGTAVAFHVFPHPKGWIVQSGHPAEKPETFPLKSDAVRRAREKARGNNARLFIHGTDGTVLNEHGYSES
jgi:hypothetical protein